MVFRPSVHLHILYLKRSSPDLEMSFSFKDEKVAFKPGARWDYVVSETKDAWKVKGMGMIPGAVIVGPSPSRKKKDKATEKLDEAKKGWREILDYAKADPGLLDRFLAFIAKERLLREHSESAGVIHVNGEAFQAPSRMKKGNPKRAQMPTDHRKRQRS